MMYLNLTSEELFAKAKEGDEKALGTLFKRYEPLFRASADQYLPMMSEMYEMQDFISIGYFVIWDIVRKEKYDPEVGYFSGYLKQAVRWRFRNEFRDYARKNYVCIGVYEDFYGMKTRDYVVHYSVEHLKERFVSSLSRRKTTSTPLSDFRPTSSTAPASPPVFW